MISLEDFLEQQAFGSFIDGKFVLSPKNKLEGLSSPLTSETWKTLYLSDSMQAEDAILTAERAWHSWKKQTAYQRADFLRKIGAGLRANRHLLASLMAMEMGKTLQDGLAEVEYAAGYFDWFAGEALRIYGLEIPSSNLSWHLRLQYEPIGVCAVMTPWNFPLAMPARKIAAALAAGCTVVCRPSKETSLSLLCVAEISRQIQLPEGVLNVLIGSIADIVPPLLNSSLVRKLSFTGSTHVGKELYQKSAPTLKKLTLELGGSAPFIILNDADIEKAVQATIQAKFRNNGQSCIAANRFFVQDHLYERYLSKLVGRISRLKVGHPLQEATEISQYLHSSSKNKMVDQLQDALSKGAQIAYQGENLHYPLVLTDCHPGMMIFQEETFGPLLGIMKFHTLDEAIFLANQTSYGLAAYAFTNHLGYAQELIDRLHFGIIGINNAMVSTPQAPFGGINYSGMGKEGGPTGIYEYLQGKYISISTFGIN